MLRAGSLLSPRLTLMDALLQNTLLMASQVGRSSMFCSTSSSSSRFFSSPSPLRVLRFILSGDKFLVNLKETIVTLLQCQLMYPTDSLASTEYHKHNSRLKFRGHREGLDFNPCPGSVTVALISPGRSSLIVSLQFGGTALNVIFL